MSPGRLPWVQNKLPVDSARVHHGRARLAGYAREAGVEVSEFYSVKKRPMSS
jgi:hypothetical protein